MCRPTEIAESIGERATVRFVCGSVCRPTVISAKAEEHGEYEHPTRWGFNPHPLPFICRVHRAATAVD